MLRPRSRRMLSTNGGFPRPLYLEGAEHFGSAGVRIDRRNLVQHVDWHSQCMDIIHRRKHHGNRPRGTRAHEPDAPRIIQQCKEDKGKEGAREDKTPVNTTLRRLPFSQPKSIWTDIGAKCDESESSSTRESSKSACARLPRCGFMWLHTADVPSSPSLATHTLAPG